MGRIMQVKWINQIRKNLSSGRYTREKFWMDVFASFIMAGMFKFLIDIVVWKINVTILPYILLYVFWIYLEIRRFHDANKPAWWAALNLIPGAGTIMALLMAGVLQSDYSDNPWCQ